MRGADVNERTPFPLEKVVSHVQSFILFYSFSTTEQAKCFTLRSTQNYRHVRYQCCYAGGVGLGPVLDYFSAALAKHFYTILLLPKFKHYFRNIGDQTPVDANCT